MNRLRLLGGILCAAVVAVGCGDDAGPGSGGDEPTCSDFERNGAETDIDCGGPDCAPCGVGLSCGANEDCTTLTCVGGTCGRSRCNDDVQNGLETDVDCGGADCLPCPAEAACRTGGDCLTLSCERAAGAEIGSCVDPCTDGRVSAGERGVDCGGVCLAACPAGTGCEENRECTSGVCNRFLCQEPACDDRIPNGDESDRDCGGSICPGCAPGQTCRTGADCASQICLEDLTCAEPACDDGFQNGDETDVDCGGQECGPCPDGGSCLAGSDCLSLVCDDEAGICLEPTCEDGVANGTETDIDCGGLDCGGCRDLRGCNSGADCLAGVCFLNFCGTPVFTPAGSDSFGYTAREFTWPGSPCPDIRETGTRLPLTDDGFATVSLPFDFEFYGELEPNMQVQANGAVSFGLEAGLGGNNQCLRFTPFSWEAQIDRLIAAWWENFNPDEMARGAGGVYVETLGTAPNRQVVVQWNTKWDSTSVDGLMDTRVVLDEGTSKITVCYVDVTVGTSTWDGGNNASSGIQQSRSGAFIAYHCNSTAFRDGLIVEYLPPESSDD